MRLNNLAKMVKLVCGGTKIRSKKCPVEMGTWEGSPLPVASAGILSEGQGETQGGEHWKRF